MDLASFFIYQMALVLKFISFRETFIKEDEMGRCIAVLFSQQKVLKGSKHTNGPLNV